MNIDYMEIIKLVLIVGLGALSYYLKTYTNVTSKVAELIAQAEEMYKEYTKAGEDKMAWCVEQLYALVPAIFRTVITPTILEAIVQNVFDSIQDYVDVKKIEIAEKINETVDKVEIDKIKE